MRNIDRFKKILPFLLLALLTLFFCCFFVGRYGIFGSRVDWISQHSAIPDYFRKQFYETGELFPEFAANIGGGQNIYNFSYYGLFSPVILVSYLFPSVKMGDYLMTASIVSLASAVMLFYGWLKKRGFSVKVSFMVSLMYLLSGPMIFHSYCQIMFVNYMPFLCMAFLGVDRYFEKGGKLLYTVSVFLMIMTSFYFSIGGMLALVLYGLYRYFLYDAEMQAERKHFFEESSHDALEESSYFALEENSSTALEENLSNALDKNPANADKKSIACNIKNGKNKRRISAKNIAYNINEIKISFNFFGKSIAYYIKKRKYVHRFFDKNIACDIDNYSNENKSLKLNIASNIFLRFLWDGIRFFCPMMTAVLMSGILLIPTAAALTGRGGERGTVSLTALWIPDMQVDRLLYTPYGIGLTTLMTAVLITGFTYKTLHDRVLSWGCTLILTIPFFTWALNGGLYIREKALIPLLPLICYIIACYVKKLEERSISLAEGGIPFLINIGLLYAGQKTSGFSKYGTLFLADAVIMAGCYLLFCRKRASMFIMVPPVVFLLLFGSVFHEQANRIESREFYEKAVDPAIGRTIEKILEEDPGFYRLEQVGNEEENAANLNRVWNMGQYISSIYSSSYNKEYHDFRKNVFGVEEPFRNDLMQSVSQNPVFLKLMGVRYLLSEKEIPGYTFVKKAGDLSVYENRETAPIVYVTDRVISETAYTGLTFPYHQMALAYGVVREGEDGEKKAGDVRKAADLENGTGNAEMIEKQVLEEVQQALEPAEIVLPEQKNEDLQITGKEDGYRVQAKKTVAVQVEIPSCKDAGMVETDRILFLQFRVKNMKPGQDISVWMEGERNKLSARDHTYYNGNTTFSFSAVLENGKSSVELKLGKGEYELTEIECFLGDWGKQADQERSTRLYQTEFDVDQERTAGNVIRGSADVKKEGYFVTSIPYDPNFEIRMDGKTIEYEKMNMAFVGFPIGEGRHFIEMTYHAPGRKAGILCSALGAGMLLVMMVYSLGKNRMTFPGIYAMMIDMTQRVKELHIS